MPGCPLSLVQPFSGNSLYHPSALLRLSIQDLDLLISVSRRSLSSIAMPFTSDTYRGRGGYAPRRGRGGWSQPFAKRQDPVKPDLQKHPLGDLILALQRSDLKPLQVHQVSPLQIHSCQYVTSYNWLANEIPTVTVPGW